MIEFKENSGSRFTEAQFSGDTEEEVNDAIKHYFYSYPEAGYMTTVQYQDYLEEQGKYVAKIWRLSSCD